MNTFVQKKFGSGTYGTIITGHTIGRCMGRRFVWITSKDIAQGKERIVTATTTTTTRSIILFVLLLLLLGYLVDFDGAGAGAGVAPFTVQEFSYGKGTTTSSGLCPE